MSNDYAVTEEQFRIYLIDYIKVLLHRKFAALLNPGTIYHYTTLEGVFGMSQSGFHKIWATSIKFLNDAKEYMYGYEVFRWELSRRQGMASTEAERTAIEELGRQLIPDAPLNVYCACFSASPDQLSQWRGYGSGPGVSLRIEFDSIHEHVRGGASMVLGAWVIYDEDKQRQYAAEFLDYSIKHITRRLEQADSHVPADLGMWYGTYMALAAMALKHPGFSEEREYRLIQLSSEVPKFRLKNGLIVPYREFEVETGWRLPLTGVTLGPGIGSPREKEVLSALLSAKWLSHGERRDGVDPPPVEFSKIPFRH